MLKLCSVLADEQGHYARRHKICQVLDCGVIGAELIEFACEPRASRSGHGQTRS